MGFWTFENPIVYLFLVSFVNDEDSCEFICLEGLARQCSALKMDALCKYLITDIWKHYRLLQVAMEVEPIRHEGDARPSQGTERTHSHINTSITFIML